MPRLAMASRSSGPPCTADRRRQAAAGAERSAPAAATRARAPAKRTASAMPKRSVRFPTPHPYYRQESAAQTPAAALVM